METLIKKPSLHCLPILLHWIFGAFLPGCYITTQGSVQGTRLMSGTPINEILSTPSTPKDLKDNLNYVLDVKEFAKNNGLVIDQSYTDFVNLGDEKAISYLVMASPKFELKLKTWSYILVGSFPYQGFFREQDRDKYAAFLQDKMNLDVSKTSAAAFSLLGWFKDPVYSTMFKMKRLHLARTLFHELTHATVWIQDAAKFNETLAEFVAEKLIETYWKDKDPKDWNEYQTSRAERPKFVDWMKHLRTDLDSLYKTSSNQTKESRLAAKQRIIRQHVSRFPEFQSAQWSRLKNIEWNNAKIMGVSLYVDDHADFQRSFECFASRKTIGDWLVALKQESLEKTPMVALASFCEGK